MPRTAITRDAQMLSIGWAEYCFATEVWKADVRCVVKELGTLPRLKGAALDFNPSSHRRTGKKPALE